MGEGVVGGYPVKDVRVRLYDGSYHTVDSSEMAFKIAGSQAMKQAMEQAGPVLLEPIMLVTVSAPEDAVGDVIGDLNSRRGRPLGMEPAGGGMTDVKAEVPMAEMLSYAPDLRSITGGRGEFAMEFLRYEEVPGTPRRQGRRGRARRAGGREGVKTCERAGRFSCVYARQGDDQGHPDDGFARRLRGLRADIAPRRAGRGVPVNGGHRRSVCELCTDRALHEGWVREGAGASWDGGAASGERRRSLLGRLRPRKDGRPPGRERIRLSEEEPPVDEPPPAPASWPEPVPARERIREPRHVRAVPTSGEQRIASAVDVFNTSEHRRTIAGVARSLGAPTVSVLASEERPSVVTVVVSWELCWYRYEADLSDEVPSVRVEDQGYELDELPASSSGRPMPSPTSTAA